MLLLTSANKEQIATKISTSHETFVSTVVPCCIEPFSESNLSCYINMLETFSRSLAYAYTTLYRKMAHSNSISYIIGVTKRVTGNGAGCVGDLVVAVMVEWL